MLNSLDDFAGLSKIVNLENITIATTKTAVVSKTETTTSHRLVVAKCKNHKQEKTNEFTIF